MPLWACKGDTIDHGGQIVTSAARVTANGKLVARKGDKVNCSQHGEQTIVQGSKQFTAEGQLVAYVGALCSCGAKITTGAANITCDPA
jgi:uncharacterized Zn-binding protein involved in type VI secretion